MKTKDTIRLTGVLAIYKDFPWAKGTKPRELIYKDENLITLTTKQLILSWIYSSLTSDPINGIKIGTGGTIDPEGLFPKQEQQTWTDLNNTITSVGVTGLLAISQVVDVTVPQVTFLADIDQATGNGNLINEAGLFRQSGGMFNVKTFPSISKSSEFSLHFEWTVKLA